MKLLMVEMADELASLLEIREEPGWKGHFSRKQFPGAIANGQRIKKVLGDPGDDHSLGARATVLGSVQLLPGEPICYFVEWDDSPRHACAILAKKIAPL